VVADVSGNGNGGSIGTAAWSTLGKFGNGLSFNGTNARVTIADAPSLRLSGAMTLEAWVFPTTVSSAWRDVLYKGDDNYYLSATSGNAGRPVGGGIFGGGYAEAFGASSLALSTWTHLATTYDGAMVRLFVNGTQVSSVAKTGAILSSANPLQIGGDSIYGQHFAGRIDEVRIYNRALSANELQTDMNTPIGASGPPDTTPPTDPTGLSATAVSQSQVNLAWTGSTDNVAVVNYRVERCQGAACANFVQVGTPTGTTYSDTGLSAATTYRYRVRAADAAGNLSGYTATQNATTPDTQAPTAPTGLSAAAASASRIDLAWTASTDNVAVTGYSVERCEGAACMNFLEIGTPTGPTFSDIGLAAATTYRYRVRAADAAGNLSGYSAIQNAATTDLQPPTDPTGLTATAVSGTQIDLAWTGSSDNVAVANYRVERCQGAGCTIFVQVATPTGTTFSDTGLQNATRYSYRVRAADAAGNLSGYTAEQSATTPDTQAPTAPTGLTATAASQSQIDLAWTASTDNVALAGYRVERCPGATCTNFVQVATPTAASYSDAGLLAATTYRYRVRAADTAANLSGYSAIQSATTPDTQAPTDPSGLSATAVSDSQVNLAWTGSTDNVALAGYRVERCQDAGCTNFVQIATPTTTTYNNTGLQPATTYRYRVRATDAAGNLSGYTAIQNATTQAASSTLVAAHSFNAGSGATVADASGLGNNGTIANAVWTINGKYGNALIFNGVNALVTIADAPSLRLTNAMTLEAWVNPTTVNRAWRDVIYKGTDNYYLEATSSRNPAAPLGGGSTFGETWGTAALAANTWTHLAVTYDRVTLRIYVNGVQVSTKARTQVIATSATPLQIGGDSLFGQYFSGTIDEVRVYSSARSAEQVQADMATAISP
jgi:chitodextrinase